MAAGAPVLFKLVPTGAPFERVASLPITKIMVVIMSSIALLHLLQNDSNRICGQGYKTCWYNAPAILVLDFIHWVWLNNSILDS
jgi:hypothetical protein